MAMLLKTRTIGKSKGQRIASFGVAAVPVRADRLNGNQLRRHYLLSLCRKSQKRCSYVKQKSHEAKQKCLSGSYTTKVLRKNARNRLRTAILQTYRKNDFYQIKSTKQN